MCEDCRSKMEPIKVAAKALGHVPEYNGKGMSDGYSCSCGWKSKVYWDGDEFAFNEWVTHAQTVISKA